MPASASCAWADDTAMSGLEAASTRAIHLKAFSYQTIKNILASGFDQMPLPIPQESNTASISHDNIRGSNYYINSTEDYPCSPSKPSIN